MSNILQRSLSRDVSPSSGPEDFLVTRGREPIAHPDQVFSVGRGGAGNIRSPSRDHNSPANIEGAEQVVITEDVALQDGAVIEASQPLVAFQSLINRSIAAWQTIKYVGQERIETIDYNTRHLRSYHSLEEVLTGYRGFWFFQLRESFMRQKVFLKWDPTRLDEYILLPVAYGFANNQDCFFVSHYWLTREHPDPQAVDLVQIQQDLKDQEWSYVWVDWTCMPQLPRTEIQQKYFNRMLRYIHSLVRDCGFAWRYPAFEPRGWILFEVAEFVLFHKSFIWTDDNRPFINHILEMATDGVQPVIEKYGYKCARQGDLNLVVGWLELSILLCKILPNDSDVSARQQIRDNMDEPYVGTLSNCVTGMVIDKANGVISYQGKTYRFTPLYHPRSD